MSRNTKFLTIINLFFLISITVLGQNLNKNFQNCIKLSSIENKISVSNLYDYSDFAVSSKTNTILKDQFELEPNNNKTLSELKIELESVPIESDQNMKLQTLTDNKEITKESKSFFKSEIFYFACTAVLATTAYLVWKKNDEPVNTSKTFGTPPLPRNN